MATIVRPLAGLTRHDVRSLMHRDKLQVPDGRGRGMRISEGFLLDFGPAPFYLFFSAVEISAAAFVAVYARRWRET